MTNSDQQPPDAEKRRFVASPVSPAARDLAPMGEMLKDQNVVKEAWIVGNELTAADGSQRTLLGIVLVVDAPVGASDDPEMRELIERLARAASERGLSVQSWGFVSPATVDYDLAAVGTQIYSGS
jgi:hypothetical protein